METSISDLARRIGVSRLANLTGLDNLGYPVVAAIRPNSRNLTVSFGKGPTLEKAKLSAVMEAAELFYSETAPSPLQTSRFQDLNSETALNPSSLEAIDAARDVGDEIFEWVEGYDLHTKRPLLVPWQIISMDYTTKAREHERVLQFGATGLAAGFEETTAILHGLLEVIERDCHNAWNNLEDNRRAMTLIDADAIQSKNVRVLLDMIAGANLEVLIWNMTGPNHVPCFLAEVFDLLQTATTAYVQGSAAAVTAAVAIEKAIAEALQIRLTYIAGSRDDLDWFDYGERYAGIVENRCSLMAQSLVRQQLPADDAVFENPARALNQTLRRMEKSGISNVAVVRLSPVDEPFSVVKIIVPSMHDTPDADYYTRQQHSRQTVTA